MNGYMTTGTPSNGIHTSLHGNRKKVATIPPASRSLYIPRLLTDRMRGMVLKRRTDGNDSPDDEGGGGVPTWGGGESNGDPLERGGEKMFSLSWRKACCRTIGCGFFRPEKRRSGEGGDRKNWKSSPSESIPPGGGGMREPPAGALPEAASATMMPTVPSPRRRGSDGPHDNFTRST